MAEFAVMPIDRRGFFSGILALPVLVYGVRYLDKPGTILEGFQNISGAKEFRTILRRGAERLQQPGVDQGRDVMRLAVQHPTRLFRR